MPIPLKKKTCALKAQPMLEDHKQNMQQNMQQNIVPSYIWVKALKLFKTSEVSKASKTSMCIPQGLALIEGLVAIIVFSIGLLGMIKMLQFSAKMQHNTEYQLHAVQIAAEAKEQIINLGKTNHAVNGSPAAMEGFLDGALCSGALCDLGKTERQHFDARLLNTSSTFAGARVTMNIKHGKPQGNLFTNSTLCNDPIVVHLSYVPEVAKSSTTAATPTPNPVNYYFVLNQYFANASDKITWGLTCN